MKVICVTHPDVWQDFCCELPWPQLDAVYTVSGLATIENELGIFLFELPPVSCSCHQLEAAPWPATCFRPLDQRQTDITIFEKILNRVPEVA